MMTEPTNQKTETETVPDAVAFDVPDAAATDAPADADAAAVAGTPDAADVAHRAAELAVLDALRTVLDPELGMDVVELALIRRVIIGDESSEVKMILTTPFCPYAGSMIREIQDAAEGVLQHPVKVTLLAERWDPRDAGLAW